MGVEQREIELSGEEKLDPKIIKEIDEVVAQFKTSDDLYAIKSEVAGFRDWEGIRHIDFGGMLLYIIIKTKTKGRIDSRYLVDVLKRNPDLTKMTAKYLIETLLPNQITQNIDSPEKEALKEEIRGFMGRHKGLVDALSNAEDIASILETMYDMGTFLGRFQVQGEKEVPSVNRAFISGYKLYSHPKLQPVMQAFWDEYIKGGKKDGQQQVDTLPVTRKIIEGKGAKVIAAPYQAFFTHKPIQDALLKPLQDPEKLLGFMRRTSQKLDQIIEIGDGQKVSRARFIKKWKDDTEKHNELRRLSLEITREFFEIYGPFFKELTLFLQNNNLTWEYFLKNGLRLRDKGDIGEQDIKRGTLEVTPDNVLRGAFGKGMSYSIEYFNSTMFMNGLVNPETLGLLFTAFLVEFFDIWGEAQAKALVGAELQKYGINFNSPTFGMMLNTTKGKRPVIHQRFEDARDILKLIGEADGKTLEDIKKGWEKFFPKKDS